MGTTPTIEVKPIYGWGWIEGGDPRRQVPEPFALELESVEPERWVGIVRDEGHEFQGRRVELSQRHVVWSGLVNIVIEPTDPTLGPTIGYGMLPEPPPGLVADPGLG